jgi:hypothetical protein
MAWHQEGLDYMDGLPIKAPATPVCAEKESAMPYGEDGAGLPTHGVDRRLWKTVKTVVSSTLVSTTTVRKAPQPDSDRMDERVSTVAALVVVVEVIGETWPAGVAKHRQMVEDPGEGDVDGGDNGEDDAVSDAVSERVDQDETIVGSGDRAHHLALKFANIAVALRQEPIGRAQLIASRQPLSRAECRRRCGQAGFCDPASELGCGGEYCGNRHVF